MLILPSAFGTDMRRAIYTRSIHLDGDGCMLQQLISAGWHRIYGYPDSSATVAYLQSDSAVLIK